MEPRRIGGKEMHPLRMGGVDTTDLAKLDSQIILRRSRLPSDVSGGVA